MLRLCLLCIATFCILGQTTPATAQVSDHYLSYSVEPRTLGVPVLVGDQFIPELQVGVMVYERLLNPVMQDNVPMIDPTAHLDWWRVEPPVPVGRHIAVTNKFGQFEWDVHHLEFLLAPSRKNQPGPPPENINHFLCYRASGPRPDVTVRLEDQFRQITAVVGEPEFFCNPCRKNHDGRIYPIVDPDVHLAVYQVLTPPFTATVFTEDQFGIFQNLVLGAPVEYLFVPSLKDEPVPVESSTWGRIKSTYRDDEIIIP